MDIPDGSDLTSYHAHADALNGEGPVTQINHDRIKIGILGNESDFVLASRGLQTFHRHLVIDASKSETEVFDALIAGLAARLPATVA